MMTRTTLVAVVAVVIGSVAIVGYDRMPEDAGLSWQEVEALANSPYVVTETDTPADETIPPDQFTEDLQIDLKIKSEIERDVPANFSFLTVEEYDPLRAREFLVAAEMPVPLRQEFLARLEKAYGNKDKMAAILKELRAQLQTG